MSSMVVPNTNLNLSAYGSTNPLFICVLLSLERRNK
jgi:hypothetical protein